MTTKAKLLLEIAVCVLFLPVLVLIFITVFPLLLKLAEMSADWWLGG
jgi:hypothetical protein